MMTRYLLVLGLLGLGMALHAQVGNPAFAKKLESLYKGTVPLITPAQLQAMRVGGKPPIILDTRAEREYQVSHIEGAIFVDYAKFSKAQARGWARDREVVVYCTVGYRSERIGEQLRQLGFQHVHNLEGGIFEWVNQGYEVVDAHDAPTQQVHAYSEDWGQWLQRGQKIYK